MESTSTNQSLLSEDKSKAKEAVLVKSSWPESLPIGKQPVKGFDFNTSLSEGKVDIDSLLGSYRLTGYQATSLGKAIEEVNKMLKWRLSDEPIAENESEGYLDPKIRSNTKCKIFLGYTSNLISSGLRESFRFLAEHKMIDVIVTTAGGVEEDFIKCLAPTFVGEFDLPGREMRLNGMNRIGNLVVPNNNYCAFEDWIMPIFNKMLEEQKSEGIVWTPSKVIHRLGKEINNPESVYYWAYKNDIPVFCPALTDGSIGDMLWFHSFQNPGLVIDIIGDMRAINSHSVHAKHTGMIILGGGIVKHHICNANLMRNGADYAVLINTAQEFDGSDAGARPDEAVSWGKIKLDAKPVKVYSEATLVFPLLMSQTFVKQAIENQRKK